MLQQMYPQVFHDYEYELNKDMQLLRHILFLTQKQENAVKSMDIRIL